MSKNSDEEQRQKMEKAARSLGATKAGDRFYFEGQLWSIIGLEPKMWFGRADDGGAPLGAIEDLLKSGLSHERVINQLAITIADATREKWGPGDEFKPIERVLVGNRVMELGFGENPHSVSNNTFYVRSENGVVEGFDGHRLPWHIEVTESNYMKTSGLSGNEVRKACECRISLMLPPGGRALNPGGSFPLHGSVKKLIYVTGHREALYSLIGLPSLLGQLAEHPARLFEGGPGEFPELVGRKVYYKNVPATVRNYFPDQGAVVIESEGGVPFPVSPWRLDGDDGMPDDDWPRGQLKDDIFSDHFWWFRKS